MMQLGKAIGLNEMRSIVDGERPVFTGRQTSERRSRMAVEKAAADVAAYPRSVRTGINYLARDCSEPFAHNGDFSKNVLPLEKVEVEVWDADDFVLPASLDVEGFCRVPHQYDIAGLADTREEIGRAHV